MPTGSGVIARCLFALAFVCAVSTRTAANEQLERFESANPSSLHGRLTFHTSNMHNLAAWWISLPRSETLGGALAAFGDILLIVRPDGEIVWIDVARAKGPYSTGISAPMNLAALRASNIAAALGPDLSRVRAAGAHVETADGGMRLYVSHHVFADDCLYFQVSAVDLAFDAEHGLTQAAEWRRLFRPSPCVRVGDALHAFAGHQAGGRIVSLDAASLLVSYGDHLLDGHGVANAPQDPSSPYGKIWKVAKDGSAASIYAIGMRNSQGLFADGGRIWESEHGAQGGDELNLIVPDANYGWPRQTFGVQYGDAEWPLNAVQGHHSDSRFEPPRFAWVPSIAPSNITRVRGPEFPLWRGDLLMGTLRDLSLRRLRVIGERVVYDERVEIGERLRDVVSLEDGLIAVLTDSSRVGIINDPGPKLSVPDTAGRGDTEERVMDNGPSRLFSLHCAMCHDLAPGNAPAPPLAALGAREIGKYPGYAYSAALASARGLWSLDSFAAYVIDPETVFPGSAMPPTRVSAEEASGIFGYLNGADPLARPPRRAGDAGRARFNADAATALAAPFTTPFAVEAPLRPGRYEPIVPGFFVGYSSASPAQLSISQMPAGPPDRYTLDVAVEATAASTFLSLEAELPAIPPGPNLIDVSMHADMEPPGYVRWELVSRDADGAELRTELGVARLAPELGALHYRTLVDLPAAIDGADTPPARIITYLPRTQGARLRLEDFGIAIHRYGRP